MFSYNVITNLGEVLIAICDRDILGKKIKNKITFEVSDNFYGGNICREEELNDILKKATVINAIGNKIVDFLIKENFVDDDDVIKIGGVSHAQIITV